MSANQFFILLFSFACLVGLIPGCQNGGADESSTSSPESSFQTMSEAIREQDWPNAFACMDEPAQTTMLGSVMIGLYMAATEESVFQNDSAKKEEFLALLASLKLDTEDVLANWGNPEVDQQRAIESTLANCEDQGMAMSRVIEFGRQHFPMLVGDNSPLGMLAHGTLGDVVTNGDSATGRLLVGQETDNGLPVSFVKQNGKWLFSRPD